MMQLVIYIISWSICNIYYVLVWFVICVIYIIFGDICNIRRYNMPVILGYITQCNILSMAYFLVILLC